LSWPALTLPLLKFGFASTIQKLLQNTHLYEIAEKSPQHFEA
jgi:hypothetical protein